MAVKPSGTTSNGKLCALRAPRGHPYPTCSGMTGMTFMRKMLLDFCITVELCCLNLMLSKRWSFHRWKTFLDPTSLSFPRHRVGLWQGDTWKFWKVRRKYMANMWESMRIPTKSRMQAASPTAWKDLSKISFQGKDMNEFQSFSIVLTCDAHPSPLPHLLAHGCAALLTINSAHSKWESIP